MMWDPIKFSYITMNYIKSRSKKVTLIGNDNPVCLVIEHIVQLWFFKSIKYKLSILFRTLKGACPSLMFHRLFREHAFPKTNEVKLTKLIVELVISEKLLTVTIVWLPSRLFFFMSLSSISDRYSFWSSLSIPMTLPLKSS